jgi:hypothetical protein
VEPLQECIERTTAGGTITGAYWENPVEMVWSRMLDGWPKIP